MSVFVCHPDQIRESINERFNELTSKRDNDTSLPYVCLVCDEIISPCDLTSINLPTLYKHHEVLKECSRFGSKSNRALSLQYKFKGNIADTSSVDTSFMNHILVSPRAIYLEKNLERPSGNGYMEGFSVCKYCRESLYRNATPKWAIVNNNCYGECPRVLTDLNDIELAFLTPVKTYAYCFTYTGGSNRKLKGSLSYYRVKHESIAKAVANFDALGLNDNIVVLLYGKMTKEQLSKARKLYKLRPSYIRKALDWLLENNSEWKGRNISINSIIEKMKNPVVVDNSLRVDSEDSNTESQESFHVFFPDGSIDSTSGGQETLEHFKELVQQSAANGFDIEFRCNLSREACADFKDNNLVNACLLQFPFGRGGMHEDRLNNDGSSKNTVNSKEYVKHLSKLSLPQFHRELFVLVMYNISMKERMLRGAGFRVRNKVEAKRFSEDLNLKDVDDILRKRSDNRNFRSNSTASRFIDSIDTVCRSVPHTNHAARKARRDGEAFQHHYGLPSLFLTVTPDDENSHIVQIFSGTTIDDETDISNLSDSELINRGNRRRKLRVSYPGICSVFFEELLDILIEEVLGYDSTKYERNGRGMFDVIAFTVSVEEQGRGTLHGHIQIWIKDFNELREKLHHKDSKVRRKAENDIALFYDKIAECKLFDFSDIPTGQFNKYAKYFPHEGCSLPTRKRKNPSAAKEQELRNLRHRCNENKYFARCLHCTKTWTNTEFVESYLLNCKQIKGLTRYPDKDARRLKALAIEHQKKITDETIDPVIIRAGYNHHVHTKKSCFAIKGRVTKNENKLPCKSSKKFHDECRYRLPQRSRKYTQIRNACKKKINWYKWNGVLEKRYIKDVCIQRSKYDAFQNTCFPAVSYSKFTCNTNISILMPGPIGQYSFKYNLKDTQADDTAEYDRIMKDTQRSLSRVREEDRTDRSEAIRRILSASFSHLSTNVVGPSLASFLTRKETRFFFSKETIWCPLRDIKSLLNENKGSACIFYNGRTPYFKSMSLDYLCRPVELEDLCVKEYYESYETVKITKKNKDEILSFVNSSSYRHPSYREEKEHFLEGVRKREKDKIIKVYQYDFPDTASFKGDILCNKTEITQQTETYSELVLMLFHPFREQNDLIENGSYTKKLRYAKSNNQIFPTFEHFLQNLQDAKSNSWRSKLTEDDLQESTLAYEPENAKLFENEEDDDDGNNDKGMLQGEDLENMLNVLTDERSSFDSSYYRLHSNGKYVPKTYTVKDLRLKGKNEAGYKNLAFMHESEDSIEDSIIEVQNIQDTSTNTQEKNGHRSVKCPSLKELMSILASRNSKRTRTFVEITGKDNNIRVMTANGSSESIIDWSRKAKLDKRQRRAFEIICGTFVLSFFEDAIDDLETSHSRLVRQRTLSKLKRLVQREKRKTNQLICFLHGPGGSGKTTVVDLVISYAKEYCSFMESFQFTSRTIVVTAMTGVAATLLLGETTHSACHLNRRDDPSEEEVEEWEETRILIVDEISFADPNDFKKLHEKLRLLKQRRDLKYGGLNVIFAGDLRQLEPVGRGKRPIYSKFCPEFEDWLNCYIELEGIHRFKDDPEWGRLLQRFRNGYATESDIDLINSRLCSTSDELEQIPKDIRYATFKNLDRDSINAALFEERCKRKYKEKGHVNDSVMVFCDNCEIKNGDNKFVSLKNCKMLWEDCGEDDIEIRGCSKRMDPVLKLYTGCRMMNVTNTDVKKGLANGTQAVVTRVVLRPGETSFTVLFGEEQIPIQAVMANQVSHIELQHTNNRINPPRFNVYAEPTTFRVKVPDNVSLNKKDKSFVTMRAKQFLIVVTNATTGHKLQGSGVDNIFIHDWVYVTNWVYVMLSRVRKMSGLFTRVPLSKDLTNYYVPKKLSAMIEKFKKERSVDYWDDADYERELECV